MCLGQVWPSTSGTPKNPVSTVPDFHGQYHICKGAQLTKLPGGQDEDHALQGTQLNYTTS